MRNVRWVKAILIIFLALFINGSVCAKEKEKNYTVSLSELVKEIRYVRDIYRFRLYEIVPTDKFINFDFCGSMVMGYSNKFIFLMDLNTKEISKFIKIPKNLIFNSAYCDEIGRVIFLTYSPTILGISKAYLYDIQSEKFLNYFQQRIQ